MLDQILEEIGKSKAVAEMDLDSVSARALPYKKGQVQSAKEKLEKLYIDYKNEILKRAVFILVTGSESNSFSQIASEEFRCFSVLGETMFKEIVDEIHPQLYEKKTASSSMFEVIDNILEKKMKQFDVMSYNSLMFDAKFQKRINNKPDMITLAKRAIVEIVGGEIVGLDALERVSKEGVNKNYSSKIVPILIHSEDAGLIVNLARDLRKLNPRVVTILAGESSVSDEILKPISKLSDINVENTGNALKEIANKA